MKTEKLWLEWSRVASSRGDKNYIDLSSIELELKLDVKIVYAKYSSAVLIAHMSNTKTFAFLWLVGRANWPAVTIYF